MRIRALAVLLSPVLAGALGSRRGRALAALALLFFAVPSFAQSKSAFQKKVEAAASGPVLKDASWGVSVRFADTGERVAAYSAERNLVPASAVKLLATAAAWSALGQDHRFKTRVYRTAPVGPDGALRGDLVLAGGGDPTLGSTLVKGSQSMEEVFETWIKKIRESGIKRIEGGIVADSRLYAGLPVPGSWPWEDIGNYYAASADALSINDNLYKIYFAPGAREGENARLLRTEPDVPGMKFINLIKTGPEGSGDNGYVFSGPGQYTATLRGTVPAGPKEFSIKGSLPEPALFAAQAFKRRLEGGGIPVSGEPKLAEGPARYGPDQLLAEAVSPHLKDIITLTHKRSFNLYAELLARALALKRGRPGTLQEGLEAVKDFLRGAGISVSGVRLFDACGLSRSNQVKAETLTGVLAFMAKRKDFDSWRDSLVFPGDVDAAGHIRRFAKGALEGKLWIKSGSLNGVRGYSGYLMTRAGRLLAFTFIVNNYSCSPAEIEELHENLLVDLSKL
ncbi:MAG: D-alanyl-D-alanine carboxypeptidase/D-alanyl-D-alanine-endopeptidase [Elusimicrobia bacterium]|nr:D-alanyl-D-alanine carboxypeptidase/D-alanyl-D-alanine-endopeptidase [Elusimicrobiota bacterium]